MNFKNPFCGGFRITSPYGERILNGSKNMHSGIDIVGISDTSVRAVARGKVVASRIVTDKSDPTWQWGNYVCILDDDGVYYYYCHLKSRAIKYGDRVESGEVIGEMGNTGYSFGAHTHFEVRFGKTTVNAAEFLGIPNEVGEYDLENQIASEWAKDSLRWALDAGIIKGKSGGDLAPKDLCTREELAVMLKRFYSFIEKEIKNGA